MKILELAPYFFPEQISSTHLTNDLYDEFQKNGFQLEVYTPSPTRGVSDEVRKKYCKIKREKLYDGAVSVNRFAMFREGRNPIIRAARYILVNIIQYFKGIHAKDIDVIFAASTPPTQGLLCGLVKKTLSRRYGKNVPFVFNLQDIFPDSLVNAGMTRKGSLIWKLGRKIENFTYRNADRIIVISEDFKRNIMEKGVPEEKIVVVPNWVNTDDVYPVEREENVLFPRCGLDPEKFYICYSGNIGHSQNVDLLVKAAKAMAEGLPEVRFVLFGEGAAKEELAQTVESENITNLILLPFQPYEDIAHVFSAGDADLIISKAGIGGSSVPSKTWGIMAAARPILASFDRDSELCKLVDQVGCGINVGADDLDALVDAIRYIYENQSLTAEMGEKGRKYVSEVLSKDKCVAAYIHTIRSCAEAQEVAAG